MKKELSGMVVGLLIGTMGIGSVAYAKNTAEIANIRYADIKMVVDGVPISVKDTNEPFIYNGTTYLPVRAVGEDLDKQVTWDGNTKTVYIGETDRQEQYLMRVCPPYDTNYGYYSVNGEIVDGTNVFSMAGKSYTNGFKVNFCNETTGTELYFNLDGKYEKLEFDLGSIDGHKGFPLMLKIYLDGNIEEIIEMDASELPKHFSIKLDHALQMKIEAVSKEGSGMWGSQFGIANAVIS